MLGCDTTAPTAGDDFFPFMEDKWYKQVTMAANELKFDSHDFLSIAG